MSTLHENIMSEVREVASEGSCNEDSVSRLVLNAVDLAKHGQVTAVNLVKHFIKEKEKEATRISNALEGLKKQLYHLEKFQIETVWKSEIEGTISPCQGHAMAGEDFEYPSEGHEICGLE